MTDEQLIELCKSHRAEAIKAGQAVERAKVDGKKMRDVRFLEKQHAAAWQRFYAVDSIRTLVY